MKKIRKLLCKIGFHSYKHKRIERFYPYKNRVTETDRIQYSIGTKSITYYDECCYCGKRKNTEHIKLNYCTQLIHKFPKLIHTNSETITFPRVSDITNLWKLKEEE